MTKAQRWSGSEHRCGKCQTLRRPVSPYARLVHLDGQQPTTEQVWRCDRCIVADFLIGSHWIAWRRRHVLLAWYSPDARFAGYSDFPAPPEPNLRGAS